MYRDPRFFQYFSPFATRNGKAPSLWQKILATLLTAAVFVLALMASVMLFAVVLSVGALAWGYLWWKTRKLRQAMHSAAAQAEAQAAGLIIEGEVVRVVEDDPEHGSKRQPPSA